MPFSGLRLKNFKCFADTGPLRLAPMTLIFGRNNSGKSSLLQSLILLRQAMGAPSFGPRLNLAGPLYAAGSYADLVHLHDQSLALSISVDLSWPQAEPDDPKIPSHAQVTLDFLGEDPQPPRLSSLSISFPDPAKTLDLRVKEGEEGAPYNLWIGGRDLGNENKADFRFPVNGLLPLIGKEQVRSGQSLDLRSRRATARTAARWTLNNMTVLLEGIHVVSAFRPPPMRRYEFQGAPAPGADATGRYVIDALIQNAIQNGKDKGVLLTEVNVWLQRLARIELMPLLPLDQAGKLYELKLRDMDSGRWANFADVGYGIGQALPVIVEGLRTPPGGTFIVQEPEIHLHPDAQLAMADFLVHLMRNGRQVIAETHSEHLLLRVRRKILAGAQQGILPEHLNIILVDKDEGPASRAAQLPIDELGQVAHWPSGFLQEANNERMALLEEMAAKVEDQD